MILPVRCAAEATYMKPVPRGAQPHLCRFPTMKSAPTSATWRVLLPKTALSSKAARERR